MSDEGTYHERIFNEGYESGVRNTQAALAKKLVEEHTAMNFIHAKLSERVKHTGIREIDGVPSVVQHQMYSYTMHAFYVLLFTGDTIVIEASIADLGRTDLPEYCHYLRVERHVERLVAGGLLMMNQKRVPKLWRYEHQASHRPGGCRDAGGLR